MTDETLSSTANEEGGFADTSDARAHTLLVVAETGVRTIELKPGMAIHVGRRADMDIVVDHAAVSRQHAVFYGGDPPIVVDVGSRNGTTVQGTRIPAHQRTPLPAGSVVAIGSAQIFVRGAGSSGGLRAEDEDTSPGLRRKDWGPRSQHQEVQELYERVKLVTASDIPVLILGETGAGKELLAEWVHTSSPRSAKPMLRVNCAALSEGILASELFGHEKGAFTGAHATKIGLFEAADGGSLFLDEIGELTMATQAKLLRVLESGEVTRVGSHKSKHVDVRIISATNRDLRQNVARGDFRADLYFRLNGVSFGIPPLRERTKDIIPLANYFAERFAQRLGRGKLILSEHAKQALLHHRWSGNVRELKHVVERAVLLSEGSEIDSQALQLDTGFSPQEAETLARLEPRRGPSSVPPQSVRATIPDQDRPPKSRPPSRMRSSARSRAEQLRAELDKAERDRIIEALDKAGTQAAAAELLGISRRALLYKLDAYGIPRPRKNKNRP